MEVKQLTGYPSIDKPWLKYYSPEGINASLPQGTAYEYIWENNKKYLYDTALIYFKRKISYKKMFENIDRTAKAFSSIGIQKGDIVAVALPNIPENIYCVYGLNKLGAVADMVDLRSKGDTLKHYLTESGATVAVVCSLFAKNTFEILPKTSLKKIIVVSPFDSLCTPLRYVMKLKSPKSSFPKGAVSWTHFLMSACQSEIVPTGKSGDAACIFHTSGTTGKPKGVVLSNLSFNAMALHIKMSGLKFNFGEVMLNQVPPFLAYNSLCATHMPLVLHMQIIMLPEYRPDKFASNIMKLRPNCAIAGPADWNNFLENPSLKEKPFDFSYLVY